MESILPSEQLVHDMDQSEMNYMLDRMQAIRDRPGNPEGVEIQQFGHALCFYSKTMPWAAFNTVKGLRSNDVTYLDGIAAFYRARERKAQYELVPGLVNQELVRSLHDRGLFQSGFHTSLYIQPSPQDVEYPAGIRIEELQENEFLTYATIHCRGTGLSESGIPHVASNNKVLHQRSGWTFYLAFVNEQPAAVAVMYIKDSVASLTFAATLPEFRSQGLQQLLLKKRIDHAARQQCQLVVSQCSFLSQSHRNMERVGMKVGYVRATWIDR